MSDSDQSGAGRREVAYRLFAAEYDDADFSYSEGDEDRAPNYVVTPTGARVNRLFVVGVLTEVESVSDDVLRARVVDPTGAFVLYAGQYQPDEQAFLERAETPTFVSVTGKARTFQPEDSDRVFTSVRPESISEVGAGTRDRWLVQTAEQTIERVGRIAASLAVDGRGDQLRATLEDHGVDDGLAAGIALAIDHYGTSPAYLQAVREMATDVARLVVGEVDEVQAVSLSPDAPGDADLEALATIDLDALADAEPVAAGDADSGSTAVGDSGPDSGADQEPEREPERDTQPEPEPTTGHDSSEPAAGTGTEPDAGGDVASTGDDVDATGESAETGTGDTDDIGDFEPGEFDLDEEEREEIEAEFGTDFQSGTEVDEPGEAEIETPDPEDEPLETPDESDEAVQPDPTTDVSTTDPTPTTDVSTADPTPTPGAETGSATEQSPAGSAETSPGEPEDAPAEDSTTTEGGADAVSGGEQAPEDVDLEDAAVDVMEELDEGGGAERDDVIETVADRHGASSEDVEAAIQDALMDGRCYEPDETTLKPI